VIEKIVNNATYKYKVVPIAIFLVIELMFLLAFNLGNLGSAYRLFAILLVIVLLPAFLKTLNEDLTNGFIFIFLPLVIFLISMAFSPVFGSHPSELFSPSISLLNRDLFTILMTSVGGIAFLLLGYFISRTKLISKTNFIFFIYTGIALLLFVSLAATLMNYGFFHRIIYGERVNYFEGSAYPVVLQANLLQGFNIETVNYNVLVTMGLLVIVPLFALLFLKELKKPYPLILIAIGSIGLLTVIFLTDFRSLIYLIPALLLALMFKFKVHKMKHFKATILVAVALGVFLIFVGILAALEVGFVETVLNSNALTRRIFYNGYTIKYMGIIKEAFDPNFLFGNPYNYSYENILIFPSGNIILDTMKETGIVGVIAFLAVIVIAIKFSVDYINHSSDNVVTKYMVLAFLVTLFTRYMLKYQFNQLSFDQSYWQRNYFPFVESKEFAISLFLIGYMYIAKTRREVNIKKGEEMINE